MLPLMWSERDSGWVAMTEAGLVAKPGMFSGCQCTPFCEVQSHSPAGPYMLLLQGGTLDSPALLINTSSPPPNRSITSLTARLSSAAVLASHLTTSTFFCSAPCATAFKSIALAVSRAVAMMRVSGRAERALTKPRPIPRFAPVTSVQQGLG